MISKSKIFAIFTTLCLVISNVTAQERSCVTPQISGSSLEEDYDPLYSLTGLELIQKELMPKHISFIMDGNRRWAKRMGLQEMEGHAKGADTFIRLLKFFCNVDLGIDTITIYAFSTENWKRSEQEISLLMNLFAAYFDEISPYLEKYSIRFETIGDMAKLPYRLQKKLEDLKKAPIKDPKFTLICALNYGGRDEIKRTFFKMASDLENGVFTKDEISEELIQTYLDTSFVKDPELIIRTSGEQRISNFLLWQMAYSEFYFSPLLWPDLSEQELINILLDYQKRDRRFGGK